MATLQLTHKLDHLLCFHRGTLRDLIGDMHASLKDGAQCVEGVGLVLDGVGAHAELAPGELGGAMSIAIRVAAKQLPVDRWTRLFDFSEHHGNLEHIFIDVHGSGGASWQTYTGPHWGPHPRSNDFKLQVGEWTTFVGIVQGDTMKFYRNGKILSQVQSPARAPPSMVRQAHLVGWSAWRDGQVAHFDGTVASMAIWSRALSDEEVEMVSACDMADMVELRVFTLNAVLSKSGAMTCCCINSAGEEAAALEVDPGKSLAWLHASIANLLGCSELSLRLVTPNGELIGESFDDWDATILSDVLGVQAASQNL